MIRHTCNRGRLRSRRFESYEDGDVIDQKIFNLSIVGSHGQREIDKEIKALIRFIKTGRGIGASGVVDVGDDFANRKSAVSRLKKILIACKKNDVLSDDEIVDLLRDLTDDSEVAKALDVLATIKQLGLPEDYPGVADLLASTQTGFGDVDSKSLDHGAGAHFHNKKYQDLEDPEGAYLQAKKRIAGVAPDDKAAKKSRPGNRQDWERSAYRVIAEDEALKFVNRLKSSTNTNVSMSKESSTDDATLVETLKAGFGGLAVNPTGRRWTDKWDGDPSQEYYGLDTAHCMVGGIALDCAGSTGDIPWKARFVVQICVPYVGSLDDPEGDYDLNAFCVAVTVRKMEGLSVSRQEVSDTVEKTFKAYVKRKGRAYECSFVENTYYPTAICTADVQDQEDSLRYLIRCACASFGEALDVIAEVDPADAGSVRNTVNRNYVENKEIRKMKANGKSRRFESNNIEDPDYGCINDSSDGSKLYLVGLWPGAGYQLYTMLVWAPWEGEALDIAADWCSENAPGLTVPKDEVAKIREEILAGWVRDEPEKYFDIIPKNLENLNDQEICELLVKEDADLFYDEMYRTEETELFTDICRYHDGGIYTWAQEGSIREVDPDDYEEFIPDELD